MVTISEGPAYIMDITKKNSENYALTLGYLLINNTDKIKLHRLKSITRDET